MKVALWSCAGLGVAACAAAITVAALLHSARFHDYLIRTLEARASQSLGVRVNLENLVLHVTSLGVDLYGIEVDGAAPYQYPPLLQVDHVQASVRIISAFQRKWYFQNVRVDHPVVRVFVDSRGVSNLPVPKSGGGNSDPNEVFDLGIRHALLDHCEAYYNNRPSEIAADLHNLEFRASFDSLLKKYSGRLAYSNGELQYGAYRPLVHNVVAEFNATPASFELTRAQVTAGSSWIHLTGTLKDYTAPVVQANYDITVDGDELARILRNRSVPTGQIRTTGLIRYQEAANRTLLESLTVNGDLSSRRLTVKTRAAQARAENIAAHYSLAGGELTLRDLFADLLGGTVKASGTVSTGGDHPHSKIEATLRGISLADARQALGSAASTLNVALTGSLNADTTVTWDNSVDDLVAHADATIHGLIAGKGHTSGSDGATAMNASAPPSSIQISSAIRATYIAKNEALVLDNSFVRTAQTNLAMNGTVSMRSDLNLRLQADDLREVEVIADLFRGGSQEHPPQPLGLAGSARFDGSVRGSTLVPHVEGQLSASNLEVHGTAWKTVRADLDASPSQVRVQHADLEPASRGRIAFDGSVGLEKWAFSNGSHIQLSLQASQLNVADLTKLAGQQIPVTGTLGASFSLNGTELNPAGNGSVNITNSTAYGQPIQSVKLTFSGNGDEVRAELSGRTTAGSVDCKSTVRPKERTYTAELTSDGVQLQKIAALKNRDIDAEGVLSVRVDGVGSFDNPQLRATVQIPKLAVHGQSISGIKLAANMANHAVDAELDSSAFNTTIEARAKMKLTGDYMTEATLDTQPIQFQPLLAVYAPDQAANITGQTEIHATFQGPLSNKNLLEAHVTIPELKVAYGSSVQLAAVSPIHMDYKNGVIDLQRAAIRGTDTDLQIQGSIPTAANGPMSMMLLGSVNLRLLQLFDRDITSSGELKLNVNSNGAASGPDLGGEIDIVDANIASNDLPVGLEHGNGVLKVTRDRINIAKFDGTVGGGTVTAQGGVAYRPKLQFDLGLATQGIRILYPQGMRETMNANLRLAGSTENAVLGGTVNLSDLSFTPAFDLTSFVSQFSGGVEAPPLQGFSQNVQLNLAVHSTNDVNLVSRALSIGGSTNLQVRGTAANPVILGRVNLTNGDVILNGERFVLNGGTVQFVNPSETQPVVNLSLTTTIQQYNISLRFQGPVDQLHPQYSSDPALPQADIINLLAFGQTTEASVANAATPANQQAESLVASQVSSQVTSRVSRIAGISQLSISPVLAQSSAQGPPGAVITIQQRVTSNVFVTYSTNVANTQSQTIQGQYQISPRVAVSATRDPNGGFAFDTLIKKSW
jgi:translocation and assembly module TamB